MTASEMYRERPPLTSAKDLEQGDILLDFILPELVTRLSFHDRPARSNKATARNEPLPSARNSLDELRILSKLKWCHAIVLSNSCDVAGGQLPILVAPINPFKFREPEIHRGAVKSAIERILQGTSGEHSDSLHQECEKVDCANQQQILELFEKAIGHASDGASARAIVEDFKSDWTLSDATKWRQISEAATGTSSPKAFYLPGHPPAGLGRSTAHLAEAYPVTASYVDRCVVEARTSRPCGLQPEAQRHLQWAMGLMFGRNPREDEAWPSREDRELHVRWLEREIGRGSAHQDEYVAALKREQRWLGAAQPETSAAPREEKVPSG